MTTHDLPLFYREAPHSGGETSREAARSIRGALPRLEAMVLSALSGCSGMTAQGLEVATGLAGNTVRPRLVALREAGLVEDSGQRERTASGRKAVVWRAVRSGAE